jgi:hypothetical protein
LAAVRPEQQDPFLHRSERESARQALLLGRLELGPHLFVVCGLRAGGAAPARPFPPEEHEGDDGDRHHDHRQHDQHGIHRPRV